MGIKRFFTLSGVAAVMVWTPIAANAADPIPAPVYRAPPVIPVGYYWTGFYVGAHVGAGWSGDGGFLGGGQVGFNYQINPQWVVGVEADIAGTTIKDGVNASFVFSSAPGFPPAIATTDAVIDRASAANPAHPRDDDAAADVCAGVSPGTARFAIDKPAIEGVAEPRSKRGEPIEPQPIED